MANSPLPQIRLAINRRRIGFGSGIGFGIGID
jgi:hypothetical protein